MSMNNQEECSYSEFEFFKRPTIQSDILNGRFEKIYPITKLEDSGQIEILKENVRNHFLDLRQSYLNIKFKVVNSHGSNQPMQKQIWLTIQLPLCFSKWMFFFMVI